MPSVKSKISRVIPALFAACASPVAAQNICPPDALSRNVLLGALHRNFQERPIGNGVLNGGYAVVEMTATPTGSGFSVILSMPDGRSCIIFSGQDWQMARPQPRGRGL